MDGSGFGKTYVTDYRLERGRPYAKPNGTMLRATLYRPADDGGALHPAALLIHGGGWLGGMRAQLTWYGRQLAKRGYVAMAIDYRRMFRWPYPNCLHDAKSAVRWLRLNADELHIDINRICALGNSAGAHLSCMLAATKPCHDLEGAENPGASSAIQAAVSLYGPSDLRYYRAPDGPLLGNLEPIPSWYISRFVAADHGVVRNPFMSASPLTYLDRETAPIMLIQGTRDWLVPLYQTERFYESLQIAGVPTEFHVVENRNHAFDFFFLTQRAHYFEKICAFLDEHLGEPDETPHTAESVILAK